MEIDNRNHFDCAKGRRPLTRGTSDLTKIERRLLIAIAVAQSDEPEHLDNYLYRLALDLEKRDQLAQAIVAVAHCLEQLGHHFQRPCRIPPICGAALTVARQNAVDLTDVDVEWP